MNERALEIDDRIRPARWAPLLGGAARKDALDVVAAIAAVAAPAIRGWGTRYADPAGINVHSLACGRSGAALFYAYCAAADLIPGADAIAAELLEESIDGVAQCAPDAVLYCGFSGVAWVAEHVNRMAHCRADSAASADDSDDPNADIDAALLDFVERSTPDAEFDLIDGLTGIGVYALERGPRPVAVEILSRVVARLSELARPQQAGVAWETPLSRSVRHGLPPEAQALFNLGLAHGQPGPIALLGHACAVGAAPGSARGILEAAVQWLLSQRLPADALSRFPSHAGAGVDAEPARCAWCYGDPGVAVALLGAARGAGRADWQQEAVAIARHTALRRAQRDDVRDAGLCHGSAGVGHIFNRVYQATGDVESGEAARYWFERTMAFRRPDGGLAGFQTWSLERTLDGEWIDDPRFLTGVTGTGLALLAAASDVEPAWDRCLLTCVAPVTSSAR